VYSRQNASDAHMSTVLTGVVGVIGGFGTYLNTAFH
jgi:hypothetical protein